RCCGEGRSYFALPRYFRRRIVPLILHWFIVNDFCCSRRLQHGFLPLFVRAVRGGMSAVALRKGAARRGARVASGGVLADGPAALGEITLARFDRRGFELGRHRVVEAVEKAEEGNDRDDVDDLRLGVMLLQLCEIGVGYRVRYLRGALGHP